MTLDFNPPAVGLAAELYLVGVGWQYSTRPIDNLSLLQQNWNSLPMKPTFGSAVPPQPQEVHYFYPLVLLSEAAKQQGDPKLAKQYATQASTLARASGRTDLLSFVPK